MKDMRLSKAFAIALAILILTVSISLPIYIRPFYYVQIEPLNIPQRTGKDYEAVKEAYDCILDYLTIPGKEFSAGDFPYSSNGYKHFKDCKTLFCINTILLFISLATVITLSILNRKKIFKLERPKGMHISYTVCKRLLIVIIAIALIASINFTWTFDLFHKLIFPQNEYWGFDFRYDPIIKALPEAYFRNCAILIFSSAFIQTAAVITINRILKRKRSRP